MTARWGIGLLIVAAAPALWMSATPPSAVQIASKKFTESVVLGEMLKHLVAGSGVPCHHQQELGGTRVLFNALLSGDIDIYPEYTGTISQELLAGQNLSTESQLRAALEEMGIGMSRPLGFNNTYAIGMLSATARRLGVLRISDLADHPELKIGFTNEFMDRGDGWPSLQALYQLPHRDVRGLDHDLAYHALNSSAIEVTDLYSTDAKIRLYDLAILDDDLQHFPRYEAVVLFRLDLRDRAPQVLDSILRLEGLLNESDMIALNARVEIERMSEQATAAAFLDERLGLRIHSAEEGVVRSVLNRTAEHLYLVVVSIVPAILVAVPLGIWAARRRAAGQVILAVVGIVQTIPALALLVLLMRPLTMVGLQGIGEPPAIAALFLYSLLPIVRNTYAGLHDVPVPIRESALALGLEPLACLRLIELPMASRTILAGIKTALVINIGFATLGALIGAGGYGQPILTGIRLNDHALILQGAVPAAALALLAQGSFEIVDRVLVPKGLRLQPATV